MNDSHLSFWDHVEELRGMLVRMGCSIFGATLLAFFFHEKLTSLFLAPLNIPTVYFLNPIEGFSTSLRLAFWVGLVVSSPLCLYFLYQFFSPALRPQEKKLCLPFLGLSALFVTLGVIFAYTITLPLVSSFFQKFNEQLGENLWSLSSAINLVLCLIIAHALVFELYVALLFLVHFHILGYQKLRKARRFSIVGIFILATLITPPDVLSQLLLAFPMILLYESAVYYAKIRMGKLDRIK